MFKQRKHKIFNYQSRFSKENGKDSEEEELATRFSSRWKDTRNRNRKGGFSMSIRTLIIILVLLLICMYLLEKKYI